MKTTNYHSTNIPSHEGPLLARAALSLIASIVMSSCASAPPTVLQETVGPRVAAVHAGGLQVYSRSIWTTADDLETPLLSFTDYDIQSADGTLFKRVVNGDEEPDRVQLPNGHYTIVAQSDTEGTISVPIAIERDKTTVVRLDQGATMALGGSGSSDLVRLPNGQAIGFRAKTSKSRPASAMIAAETKVNAPASKRSKG